MRCTCDAAWNEALEAAVLQCIPRPGEDFSRGAITGFAVIAARIRALKRPVPEPAVWPGIDGGRDGQ